MTVPFSHHAHLNTFLSHFLLVRSYNLICAPYTLLSPSFSPIRKHIFSCISVGVSSVGGGSHGPSGSSVGGVGGGVSIVAGDRTSGSGLNQSQSQALGSGSSSSSKADEKRKQVVDNKASIRTTFRSLSIRLILLNSGFIYCVFTIVVYCLCIYNLYI